MHGQDVATEDSGCPICLQSYEPIDKAVISSCLHAFCIGCLQAWCRKSETRLCPLCKRKITGYLYDIRSDHEYKEHVFDDVLLQQLPQIEQGPAPPLLQARLGALNVVPASQQQGSRVDTEQQLAHRAHGETQRPRVQLRSEAAYTWGDPSEWRRDILQASRRSHSSSRTAAPGSSSSQQRHGNSNGGRGVQMDQADDRNTAGANGDGSVAPRPYYWRVQQRMLASVTRQHSSSSTTVGDSNTALETRRAIYRNNLWALPHPTALTATANHSGSSSSSSMRVSETALESWMERELQALLMEDDVTIICAYVKGLVNSFGVAVPTAQQQGQQQEQQQLVRGTSGLRSMRHAATQAAAAAAGLGSSSTSSRSLQVHLPGAAAGAHAVSSAVVAGSSSSNSSATIATAVAALEGFLFEAAGHFWHELCCYATSGLTVAAWDRAARYVHASELQQRLPKQQQQQAAADCGAADVSEEPVHMAQLQQQQQQEQEQQGQQVTAQPLLFDQQLSLMRDAVAVQGFLERQQRLQQQQDMSAPTRSTVQQQAAHPPTAAAAGAELQQQSQQAAVADRPRAGSSSGSSSTRQRQRDRSGSRHNSLHNRSSTSRCRSRSADKGDSSSRHRSRSTSDWTDRICRHKRSNSLDREHEGRHKNSSSGRNRTGSKHRSSSSGFGHLHQSSPKHITSRPPSRQLHSGLHLGSRDSSWPSAGRNGFTEASAAEGGYGSSSMYVGGGRWGEEEMMYDLHGGTVDLGLQQRSNSLMEQIAVGGDDRWQLES